jgi:hypothetical protein
LRLFDLRRPIVAAVPARIDSMDDVLMLVLIAVLFLLGWGLAEFCERLSARGRL